MNDRFINIAGHPGYEINSAGVVRSWWNGKVQLETPRILPTHLCEGYPRVSLSKRSSEFVHRLVLDTFVGPCPPGKEACHNNGIRTDCRLDNLRWDTRKNNHADKRKHSTHQAGDKNAQAILTEMQVVFIKRRLVAGETCKAIAADYGVDISTIGKIRSGVHWQNVAPELNAQFPDWKRPLINGNTVRRHAMLLGLNPRTVYRRLKQGLTVEEALADISLKGRRIGSQKAFLSDYRNPRRIHAGNDSLD